jgi:phosphoribosylformylglycinamidine synthase subunit PurL
LLRLVGDTGLGRSGVKGRPFGSRSSSIEPIDGKRERWEISHRIPYELTRDEFGGSEWAHVVHGHLGGTPPKVDLERERLLAEILIAGSRDGMVSAAHDLSDGGLAQTLVEMALIGQTGARVILDPDIDPFVQLFSESAGRAVVAVPRSEELRFTEMCSARGLPWRKTGVVDPESEALEIQGVATFPLYELRAAWEGTLPALFD